jgi:hypothetical protein
VRTVELRDVRDVPWRPRPAALHDARYVVASPTRFVIRGETVAIYGEVPPELVRDFRQLDRREWERVVPNRGHRSNGDLEVRQRSFGFRFPNPRKGQFHAGPCSLNVQDLYPRLRQLSDDLVQTCEVIEPRAFDEQRAWVSDPDHVRPEYRMTPEFTGGVINIAQVKFHRDTPNLDPSWSVTLWLRHNAKGGRLVIPGWNLAFLAGDRHFLMFNGGQVTHGVTAIQPRDESGFRVSIVSYASKRFQGCRTPREELLRSQERHTRSARAS